MIKCYCDKCGKDIVNRSRYTGEDDEKIEVRIPNQIISDEIITGYYTNPRAEYKTIDLCPCCVNELLALLTEEGYI